jgi:long-subunit acyl-CoA synthetase (AMP-forming)
MGQRNEDGLLRLTGRVKELFKTSKGKYVAPAPIENRINANPLVEMSLISGVGQSAAYAMVVLAEDLRRQQGNAAVRAKVESELSQLLTDVNKDLADYEKLRMIVVSPQPWTIENGCLTPTMKIRRSRIESTVDARVSAWYTQNSPVIWA